MVHAVKSLVFSVLTRRERFQLSFLLLATVLLALFEIANVASVLPFLMVAANPQVIHTNPYLHYAYERLGFENVETFLVTLGLVVFTALAASNSFIALTMWAVHRFVWNCHRRLSVEMLERYLYRPYSFFITRNTATLRAFLLSEIHEATSGFLLPALVTCSKLIVALALILFLIAVRPVLALLISTVVGGAYLVIYRVVRARLDWIGKQRVAVNRERYHSTGEAFEGIKDVKLLGAEAFFADRFARASEQFARSQATAHLITILPRYAVEIVSLGAVILIALYAIAHEGMLEQLIPLLGLYAFAGYRLMPVVHQTFHNVASMRYNLPALRNLCEELAVVGEPVRPVVRGARVRPLEVRRSIELRNVTFTYPNASRPAIRNLNVTIPACSTVGLVGRTGSGKTTTADLVLGLLRPQEGQILVDGVPVGEENLRAWQASIGYVPQHIFLADATVARNIAFGLPEGEIDRAAVEEAARLANIHDFVVRELPAGYDTVVGERGVRLSGGQRQRIGIARALYRNPAVLVLDEATSALDNETEGAVMEAIRTLAGKKTIIIIAHRITTLRFCDAIYVLEDGEMVGEGSYTQLIRAGGDFRRMVAPVSRP